LGSRGGGMKCEVAMRLRGWCRVVCDRGDKRSATCLGVNEVLQVT
jgi:hypothetical protein